MARGIWVCGVALAGVAAAAHADVKAGADAWGRGDYAAAVREWQGPAEQGDPDAQFDMGQAYRLGRGVARDLTRAEDLFGKAAAQGHIQAADNYGLLLFDRGQRQTAMPYIRTAAERGDPRAQYLMGIAHFNGDLAPRDWPRAYALMTLAQGAGLAQANSALAQMNQNIPLAERQTGATLATRLGEEAAAKRSTQLATADLSAPSAPVTTTIAPRPAPPAPQRPDSAVPAAIRLAQGSSAATAGADYARPEVPAPKPVPVATPVPKPATAPKPEPVATAKPAPSKPAPPKPEPARPAPAKPAPAPAAAGKWRVQLGAFGVAANADALWAKVKGRPELAGHGRLNVPAGKVIKLQAGGFASREAANAACNALSRSGIACVPAQD